jgi:hypothetical protein
MNEKLEIGPYNTSRDIPTTESMLYKDVFGFFLSRRNTVDGGRGDCIGLNFTMYFIYNDDSLVSANERQWYRRTNGKYVGDRHPEKTNDVHPMSRDHYLNTLMSLKLFLIRNQDDPDKAIKCSNYRRRIEQIHRGTGGRISSKARKTIELRCYSQAIQDKLFFEFLYYLLEILTVVLFYRPLTWLAVKIGQYNKEVDQDEWTTLYLQNLPKYKQVIHRIAFPSYALIKVGWKLYLLNGMPRMNRFVKRLYRPLVGRTNYVQRMLFGEKDIPRDKVESFKAMHGGRWSSYLNQRNDRWLHVLNPQPIYNVEDVDLVRKLYNETQV